MHSSRMRTVHSSSRLQGVGGGLLPGGVPGPQGGVPGAGGSAPRGSAWSGGGLLPGGSAPEGGGSITACTEADPPPPWTDREL